VVWNEGKEREEKGQNVQKAEALGIFSPVHLQLKN